MRIERKIYLDKVVESRHNGMIKVITGVRRSGKSYLLFELTYKKAPESIVMGSGAYN